jgi:hypothetical protein
VAPAAGRPALVAAGAGATLLAAVGAGALLRPRWRGRARPAGADHRPDPARR